MARERQQAGPVPTARFPGPAPPVRFRPSLPGVFDPGDEFIGPPNRLVNILKHGQALCEGGVHLIPSLSLGNGRRPGLRPPVGEKPPAGGPRSRKVNLGSGVNQLEVDEIAGTIARAGDGVELLGDLVVERHEGSPAGRGNPIASKSSPASVSSAQSAASASPISL